MPFSPVEVIEASFDYEPQHEIWVTVEDLDLREFEVISDDKVPAPVIKRKTAAHPRRIELEASAFMMRNAPKVTLEALPVDVEETYR